MWMLLVKTCVTRRTCDADVSINLQLIKGLASAY